ncbi:hypothetical protein CW304_08315 [Bacillus sp. UFRGS-B20]|nr:hypothetical protein CW304_08315 [Bacillus sp. UFRGS-B20]
MHYRLKLRSSYTTTFYLLFSFPSFGSHLLTFCLLRFNPVANSLVTPYDRLPMQLCQLQQVLFLPITSHGEGLFNYSF